MREVNGVGNAIVKRSGTIFEERHHLGVDRSKDDQSTSHLISLGSQSIDPSLQERAKFFVALPVKVLKLVKDEDIPSSSHSLQ